MEGKNFKILISVVVALLIIGGGYFFVSYNQKPGELDDFAKCLKDKGAVFYGAFWCPHCQNQKTMFGKSAKLLPYVECSTLDGRGQLQVCKDKNIQSYPTWDFSDGSRKTGEIALDILAEKTGCALPTK